VLRRIFGPKRDEVTGKWRKLHNEERNILFSSPNIVRVKKSRRMRWAGHVARMRRGDACSGFLWGNLEEREHWGDPGIDGRILRWIFRKLDGGVDWIELAQDRNRCRALVNAVMNFRVP